MELTLSEKLAMVNVIDSVILADGLVHKAEINELSFLMGVIDFDSNFLIQARNINAQQSLKILKEMTQDKKNKLGQILQNMAISDGFVHEKENELISSIYLAIGISKN